MGLELKPAYDQPQEVKQLFSEYTDMLVREDPSFQVYLDIQNYDQELEHLEAKYGQPRGRLYLARYDGKTAGCIGLRELDDETCEMKRLYVRPEFRGKKIGNRLVEQIIADAKAIGYRRMLLDTLPFLKGAIHMYRQFGFREAEAYNDSPVETTIFMELDL